MDQSSPVAGRSDVGANQKNAHGKEQLVADIRDANSGYRSLKGTILVFG